MNVAAAKEIALQLRLRDIGGLVMIDYIDMHDRAHRKEVETAFLEAAQNDRAQLTFLPISSLGAEAARWPWQPGRRIVADIKGMPIDPTGRRRSRARPGTQAAAVGGAGTGRGRGRGRAAGARRNGYGGSPRGPVRRVQQRRDGRAGNRRFRVGASAGRTIRRERGRIGERGEHTAARTTATQERQGSKGRSSRMDEVDRLFECEYHSRFCSVSGNPSFLCQVINEPK